MITVDGSAVTAAELFYWLISNADNIVSYYQYLNLSGDVWDTEPVEGVSMSQFLLDDGKRMASTRTLILSHAAAEGIELSEEEQQSIADSLDSVSGLAQRAGLTREQFLARYGLTEQLYLDNCQCDYYFSGLTEKLYGDPDEQDILNYLEDQGTYRAQHILLLAVDDANQPLEQEEIDRQRALADDLLSQIRASDDPVATFRALMPEYTQDPGYAANPDGYLAEKDQMVPEFEQTALALNEGEISEVITTDYGFHIILRCPLDVDPAQYAQQYAADRMSDLLSSWVDGAKITEAPGISLLDVKTAYEAVVAYRAAADAAGGEDEAGDASASDLSLDASIPEEAAS